MKDLTSEHDLEHLADEALMEAYRRGDDRAFTVLVERYRIELFQFLYRFTNDAATADDLFQEAFLQVHLSADTFDTSRRFRPWLFTIAANKARDLLRKNNRQSTQIAPSGFEPDSDEAQPVTEWAASDILPPDEQLQNEETRQLVQQVVASLPDHLREVLLLAYFHQFAYKQIAEMLGIPLGTVKSRLHAAVGTFANLWKQRWKNRG